MSLVADGITGGLQDRIKKKSKELNVVPKPYDLMFWTNLFMAAVALVVAVALGDFNNGLKFVNANPVILEKILKFAVCSAVGQSFIFYTISEFNSLVCTTVTTTRKVFSVLLSIFLHGHTLSPLGWAGIATASAGILSELLDSKEHKHGAKAPTAAAASTSAAAASTSAAALAGDKDKKKK
jgi:UDP-galactose transporter B1